MGFRVSTPMQSFKVLDSWDAKGPPISQVTCQGPKNSTERLLGFRGMVPEIRAPRDPVSSSPNSLLELLFA